jgi:hypothetical protein
MKVRSGRAADHCSCFLLLLRVKLASTIETVSFRIAKIINVDRIRIGRLTCRLIDHFASLICLATRRQCFLTVLSAVIPVLTRLHVLPTLLCLLATGSTFWSQCSPIGEGFVSAQLSNANLAFDFESYFDSMGRYIHSCRWAGVISAISATAIKRRLSRMDCAVYLLPPVIS